jgi:hypothetical protein
MLFIISFFFQSGSSLFLGRKANEMRLGGLIFFDKKSENQRMEKGMASIVLVNKHDLFIKNRRSLLKYRCGSAYQNHN